MFTGVVFVERNRPVAMLAFRHAPTRPMPRYGPPQYPNQYPPPHQRHLFDEDEEEPPPAWRPSRLWDR